MQDFQEFPKIPRLSRDMVVTEKLDGTNAQIVIEDLHAGGILGHQTIPYFYRNENLVMAAGSRNRWLKPGKETDNYGFAAWVMRNAEELLKLGVGRHYGEWWGQGIQGGYGLKEKRFSLFNTGKWHPFSNLTHPGDNYHLPGVFAEGPDCVWRLAVDCCYVVPVLYTGPFDTKSVQHIVEELAEHGSFAAPGYMKPEGVVVYHTAAKQYFKKTIHGDEKPKGQTNG